MAGNMVLLVIFGVACLGAVDCLRCYQCINMSEKSKNVLGGIIDDKQSHVNENCRYPWMGGVPEVECPADSSCGYMSGSVETKIPIVGEFTTTFEVRDCIPDTTGSISQTDGCSTQITKATTSAFNTILNFLDFGNAQVDGRFCWCYDDNCDANCSGLFIADFCFEKWQIALMGIGGLILASLIFTCCCCCCCACCRKKSPGPMNATRQVIVMSTPGVLTPQPPYARMQEEA